MMIVDLHCHSHYSDGTLSPHALIEQAIAHKVKLLALTDHDTCAGIQALKQASLTHASLIKVLPGIEFSVRWKKLDIHLVGLNIDVAHDKLSFYVMQQQEARLKRAHKIAESLEHLGISNAFAKVVAIAQNASIGRPHFAQLLINEKKVNHAKAAFKQYLGRGRPAYVATEWLSLAEAIAVIQAAGGMAVLAHPLKYKLTHTKLHELVMAFKAAGGQALEVVSGTSTLKERNEMSKLCQTYDLFASSGSDYHGNFSRIGLGQQSALPEECQPIWQHWII